MQPPSEELPPERIDVSNSAVRSLSGGQVNVTQSAVQNLLAAEADIRQSSVGSAKGERVTLKQSFAGLVIAQEASLEQSRPVLLAARRVNGSVRPVLTVQSAFALGFGFFFGRWLMKSIARLFRG
jgi:hypothetical protein